MKKAPKKNKSTPNTVYIDNLEPFTSEDFAIIKPFKFQSWNDWELHVPEQQYFSKKVISAHNKVYKKWVNDPKQRAYIDSMNQPEIGAPILGYKNVPEGLEYYIFKRQGKFYTMAANAFEHTSWAFLGGDSFDIMSKVNEFSDLKRAINFVLNDAKKLNEENVSMTEQSELDEAPKKAGKVHKVRLDKVYINQLEHFIPEELDIIKPYIDAAPRDWELHAPEDEFYSKKSLAARDAAHELWYDTPNATDADWSEFPAVLGYKKVPGMAEYYVYKRKGKFYTVASNAFEYNTWFVLGDDFEIISKLHEFTDLKRAINFVINDAKKLSAEDMLMTGHISSGGSQPQLTESELISPYEADEIFEKFGVKNAMLMSKDALKKAYRTLAVKHHPDRGGDAEDMKQINAAYESLKVNDGSGESGGTVRPPTRQDYEDSTALEFLFKLKEKLSRRLNPKTLPMKGKVGIAITPFKGGWMQISFIMTNNQVGIFDVVKRGNKIRIHDPFDYGDEPEYTVSNDPRSKSFFTEFDLNDIDGLVAWIISSTNARLPAQIKSSKKSKLSANK